MENKPQYAKSFIAILLFQWIPTLAFAFYLLWNAGQHLSLIRGIHWQTGIAFGTGMFVSMCIYIYKVRFLPPFLLTLILYWFVKALMISIIVTDIETVFVAHQFNLYGTLFFIGWLIQYILIRWRIGAIITAVIFLSLALYLNARLDYIYESSWENKWIWIIGPIILYGIYIIYITEKLREFRQRPSSFGKLSIQAIVFLLLSTVLFATYFFMIHKDIEHTLEELRTGAMSDQENSQLEQKEDGYSIKDKTNMGPSNQRSNELLMAAYIDNFFENSDIPNPLYLTAFYYASFDSVTETFQKGLDMPDKDLFQPALNQIPLYTTVEDSSVLAFTIKNKGLKTVDIEVYNKALSNSDFVAPTTAFFVQPIAVHQDYLTEYKSAYRAKSYVSELNSAYFVYNSEHPEAKEFQAARTKILQQVQDFKDMDSSVYAYYTQLPNIPVIAKIKDLTLDITQGKELPIDQLLAIKDFFLRKDNNGKTIFKYTDNPGIPDIPSASKLDYFLFENKKGYCAHYAGATLFMLRSLGIPSRIVAGFLTEDRSSTNPGWYYFYANQVHAWIQVYFPGFGWLDFDTTIGNEEARESEQTDATPPLQPAKATMALSGEVVHVDTNNKRITVATKQIVFRDKNFIHTDTVHLHIDAEHSKITRDTNMLTLASMQALDSITAISYGDWTKIEKVPNKFADLVDAMDPNIAVDLIQIKKKLTPTTINNQNKVAKSYTIYIWIGMGIILLSIILYSIFRIPHWILQYYQRKATHKAGREGLYYQYLATKYYLWMNKLYDGHKSIHDVAKEIDTTYNTQLQSFLSYYQSVKYSPNTNEQFSNKYEDSNIIMMQQIDAAIPIKVRKKHWRNVAHALKYFFNTTTI